MNTWLALRSRQMGPEIAFDPRTNVLTSGMQSLVIHCHFYNCALQEAIEASMGEDAPALLAGAAQRVVHAQLEALGVEPANAYSTGSEIFRALGFGTLDFSNVEGGEVVLGASHYAMGWVASRGARSQPVCYFAAGFIEAIMALAEGRPDVEVGETRCYVAGGNDCAFSVKVPG